MSGSDPIDNMGKPISVTTQLRSESDFATLFPSAGKPDTYIFYVTRKLKYYEAPTSP